MLAKILYERPSRKYRNWLFSRNIISNGIILIDLDNLISLKNILFRNNAAIYKYIVYFTMIINVGLFQYNLYEIEQNAIKKIDDTTTNNINFFFYNFLCQFTWNKHNSSDHIYLITFKNFKEITEGRKH